MSRRRRISGASSGRCTPPPRGTPRCCAGSGSPTHQARVGLALLLDCEAARDNIGLFREALPAGTPLAHKNGWIRAVRHDAAIVYAASGPRIVVLLTYRDAGLDRRTAARLGASVLAATAPRD